MLSHTCAGTRGASGGPLLAKVSDGWVVIGIVSTAKMASAGGYAVPMAAIDPIVLEAATAR